MLLREAEGLEASSARESSRESSPETLEGWPRERAEGAGPLDWPLGGGASSSSELAEPAEGIESS